MNERLCPECGAENEENAQFCINCGYNLKNPPEQTLEAEKIIICPVCGSENKGDTQFCATCGQDLTSHQGLFTGFKKRINWTAVIAGLVVFVVLGVVLAVAFQPQIVEGENYYIFLGFLLLVVFSGLVSGYLAGKEYMDGIVNGIILGILLSVILGLIVGIFAIFVFLIIFIPLYLVGGMLGVFIKKTLKR